MAAASCSGSSISRCLFEAVSLTLIFIHVIATAINFDFIWVMTQGGPLNASETLPILIYRFALEDFDVGAASALATMTIGFMLAAFFVYWYGVRRPKRGRPMVTGRFQRWVRTGATYATLALCRLLPISLPVDGGHRAEAAFRSAQSPPDLLDRASDVGISVAFSPTTIFSSISGTA